jgi:hypothetical protein
MVTHDALLRPLALAGSPANLPILQRPLEDLVPRLTEALRRAPAEVQRAEPPRERGTLRLLQPIHRVANLVLLDVACDVPGHPRLDPRRIASSGVVVRRVDGRGRQERWVTGPDGVLGWRPVLDADDDPDPALRPSPCTGDAALDAELTVIRRRLPGGELTEQVTRLYPIPADAALGRTALFGVLPTAWSELPEPSPAVYDDTDAASFLTSFFAPSSAPVDLPLAAAPYTAATFRHQLTALGNSASPTQQARAKAGKDLLDALQRLVFVLDVARDPSAAAALRALRALDAEGRHTGPDLLTWIQTAAAALLDPTPAANGALPSVAFPARWPAIPRGTSDALRLLARRQLPAKLGAVSPEGRFERPGARYVAVPFVRVRGHDGCPPRLVWGPPTEPFEVAPWFEPGGRAGPRIALPDITRESVKKLAPNVHFLLPPSIKAFLDANSPSGLLDGDVKEGGGLGIRFICGFNIPIITLCAFILLWVVVMLLNIVFWWLPYIILCLPFPTREES